MSDTPVVRPLARITAKAKGTAGTVKTPSTTNGQKPPAPKLRRAPVAREPWRLAVVPFVWTLRDMWQGWRGVALLITAAVPTLFLGLIGLVEGAIPRSQAPDVFSILTTAFIFPGLASLMALLAGGAVLRTALEDGTAVYFMTRAEDRFRIGMARSLAAAVSVAAICVFSVMLIMIPLGNPGMFFSALPGLIVGGFAIGALYGLIISLHRFALGAALLHAVYESGVSRTPLGTRYYTISYHAWGWMGSTATKAAEEGVIPDANGFGLVALLIGLAAVVLTGLFFRVKQFHLGVAAEA